MYVTVPPAIVLVGVPGDPLEIDWSRSQIAVNDKSIYTVFIVAYTAECI